MKSHISERDAEVEAATIAFIVRRSLTGTLGFMLAISPLRSLARYSAFADARRIKFISVGSLRSRPETAHGYEFNPARIGRSEEHTSELQSLRHLVCRLLLEKKKKKNI